MRIWHDPGPGSGMVGLEASVPELRALAALIDSGGGTCSADGRFAPEPAPPGVALLPAARVRVLPEPDAPVAVRPRPDDGALRVEGGRDGLAVLAAILRDMADTPDCGHVHIEYFPGHAYLAADSAPLVVAGPNGG